MKKYLIVFICALGLGFMSSARKTGYPCKLTVFSGQACKEKQSAESRERKELFVLSPLKISMLEI